MTKSRSQKARARASNPQPRQRPSRPLPPPRAQGPPPRRRQPPRQAQMRGSLSECAANYAMAVVDPRSSQPACNPGVSNAQRAMITKTFSKGSFTTQASDGFGFIAVDPLKPANDYGGAHQPISFSNSLSTAHVIRAVGLDGVTGANHNGPFGLSSFPAEVDGWNVVACGLYIQNVTNQLTAGGSIVGLKEPDNHDLAGKTYEELAGYPAAKQGGAGLTKDPTDWRSIYWCPSLTNVPALSAGNVTIDEYDYSDSTNNSLVSRPVMAFAIQADPATPQTFLYEVWWHFMYTGKSAMCDDLVDLDPQGTSIVKTAIARERTRVIDGNAFAAALGFVQRAAALAVKIGNGVAKVGAFVGKVVSLAGAGN